MSGSKLITISRLRTLNACALQHYYRYEVGLRSDRESKALRIGRIYHVGLDMLAKGFSGADVLARIAENYKQVPDYADAFYWNIECETVARLLIGWHNRWLNDGIEIIGSEYVFHLPIVNPKTGAATPNFKHAGKIDQVVRLPDGRIAIREFKTASENIDPSSDYWDILRLDPQVSAYFAAEPDAETILYDVTRKPAIAPSQIPCVDEFGFKIVCDANGNRIFLDSGKPRQTADKEKGFFLLTRTETVEEFGQRLSDDIEARPDFYYARREIPRLSADMSDFQDELWQQQIILRHRQKNNLWPRNATRLTCNFCEYKSLCFNGITRIFEDHVPIGYVKAETIHPELEETENDKRYGTAAAPQLASDAI